MLNSGDQNSAERLHAVSAAWQAAPTPRGSSRDALPGARDADHYLVHKGEPDLAKALATATAADHIRHLARSNALGRGDVDLVRTITHPEAIWDLSRWDWPEDSLYYGRDGAVLSTSTSTLSSAS
jgi:hypothetical protein